MLWWSVAALASNPPSMPSTWWSVGPDGCSLEARLEVRMVDGTMDATIVQILEPGREGARCEACKGVKQGRPMEGLLIAWALSWDGARFAGGTVLDPVSGREYSAKAELQAPGVLKLRGYVGLPVLGRTVTWLTPEAYAVACAP